MREIWNRMKMEDKRSVREASKRTKERSREWSSVNRKKKKMEIFWKKEKQLNIIFRKE